MMLLKMNRITRTLMVILYMNTVPTDSFFYKPSPTPVPRFIPIDGSHTTVVPDLLEKWLGVRRLVPGTTESDIKNKALEITEFINADHRKTYQLAKDTVIKLTSSETFDKSVRYLISLLNLDTERSDCVSICSSLLYNIPEIGSNNIPFVCPPLCNAALLKMAEAITMLSLASPETES